MKRGIALSVVVLSLALGAAVLSLLSCGGGGGSSGGFSTGGTGTGTVAVLLADGPADEFEHIWLTITEVSLIPASPNAAPVIIFQSGVGLEVDLLEYRDEDYLLTVKKGVPSGLYSKIRLKVRNIEVEPKQNPAPPCSVMEIRLPSGKIDLNPREPFWVSPGGTLSIRLDIDANKSIHLHQAGRSGKCIFRPVVFVDIKEGILFDRCPKVLRGTIENLNYNGANQVVGFTLALRGGRGSVEVRVQENTPVFNNFGECTTPQALRVGDEVGVRGGLASGGVFEASFVVIGQLLDVTGTVLEDPVFNGQTYTFTFEAAGSQELVGQFPVQGQACTLTLIGCDTLVSPQNINAGMTVRIFGKGVSGNQSFVIRAAGIVLRDQKIAGQITSITAVAGGKQVTILQNSGETATVFIPNGTPIYLEGDGTVPMDLLCVGQYVWVYLDPSTPPTAALVKVQAEGQEGTVISIDTSNRTLTVDLGGGVTGTVYVALEATILENRDDFQSLKSFNYIQLGDYIRYFGLRDCSIDSKFHAFVLVITDKED